MKTRSGAVYALCGRLADASIAAVQLNCSFGPLLKTATDEEVDRCQVEGSPEIQEEDDLDEVDAPRELAASQSTFDAGPSQATQQSAQNPPPQHPRANSSDPVKLQSRNNRRRKRKRGDDPSDESLPTASPAERLPPIIQARLLQRVDRVALNSTATTWPCARNAYTARTTKIIGARSSYTTAMLDEMGMTRISYLHGTLRPFVDRDNLVIGCFADKPSNPPPEHPRQPGEKDWDDDLMDFHEMSCSKAENARLRSGDHKRGHHIAVNTGLLLPPGSKQASRMKLGPACGRIIQKLVGTTAVQRMAAFQSAAFDLWAPRLHAHYHKALEDIREHDRSLKSHWRKSVFPMACFNLSRDTVCFRHRDVMNLPYGWCAITALGRFDHTKSACIILWELNIYLEFPHGTTVFIPSASITHSNTVLTGDNETRSSFTQYFPGFLMRWRDNGFVTDRELKQQDPARFKDLAKWKLMRWSEGIALLSTYDEIMGRLGGEGADEEPYEYESEEEP